MMAIRLLKLAFLLTLVFAALVGLIRAQPYDDSELRAFLTPPDGCPMPCFMGIRPGVTTADEAMAILEAQGWGDSIDHNSHWPMRIRPNRSDDYYAEMYINNLIVQINLYKSLPFGELWLYFDHPETGIFNYVELQSTPPLSHLVYEYGGLTISMWVDCQSFWLAETIVIFGAGYEYSQNYDIDRARELSCNWEQITF